MSIFNYFLRKKAAAPSASMAKERLQIIVAHERNKRNAPDYLPLLQQEILEVIRKYVEIDQDHVAVQREQVGIRSELAGDQHGGVQVEGGNVMRRGLPRRRQPQTTVGVELTHVPAGDAGTIRRHGIGPQCICMEAFAAYTFANTSVPLVPPKPNEFDIATSTCASRAVLGM